VDRRREARRSHGDQTTSPLKASNPGQCIWQPKTPCLMITRPRPSPYLHTWHALHQHPCMTSLGCRLFGPELRAGLVRTPIGTPVRWATGGCAMGLTGSHPAPSKRRFDGLGRLVGADAASWAILPKADGRPILRAGSRAAQVICSFPSTITCAKILENLAHVNVFGSNRPESGKRPWSKRTAEFDVAELTISQSRGSSKTPAQACLKCRSAVGKRTWVESDFFH